MDDDEPDQGPLVRLPGFAQIHEGLEQLDPGNRDDRGKELELEAREIDLAEPRGSIFMVCNVEPRDETVIAREKHDQNEIGDERQVNERQDRMTAS